jgi:putative ubiquitin-RnfH superfamily antitoxin RatB of RatAB toxin-antitoxin module
MATRKKKVVKPISAGVIPFDNGKIKMGIYYKKPMYVEEDKDMLEIQKWLIGDPDKLRFEYWTEVAFKVLTAVVVLIVLLMYVKN